MNLAQAALPSSESLDPLATSGDEPARVGGGVSCRTVWRVLIVLSVGALVACGGFSPAPSAALAQVSGPASAAGRKADQSDPPRLRPEEVEKKAEAALAQPPEQPRQPRPAVPSAEEIERINYLDLLIAGGHLMWPILAMSILVVTFGVERLLGLRRHRVLPPELINGLGILAGRKGGFDPRRAYKLCQQYPSAAANVIRSMLLKTGRPHSEVEHAVSEAHEREAARLYANVRWLSLAAGISPLLGLLGTVWGMIMAFFVTANLPTGANKAEKLAEGIYMALVTTFAGLAVAIPAAVLAHLFESRIQRLFRELDESLLGLMPQMERFEGRLRLDRNQLEPLTGQAPEAAQSPTAAQSTSQQPSEQQSENQPAAAPK